MLYYAKLTLILITCFFLWGCSKKGIKIGFSQCTGGEWREQMNRQMRSEINFYENASLEIRNAEGNINKQIEDIHYFIEQKVDLLILSPFEDKALVDAFNSIDFKGIPILLVDRNISSNKHVTFVGASNMEVGKIAAEYTLKQLPENSFSKVLHIRGYEKSSATEDRQKGFVNVLKDHGNVEVIVIEAGKDLDGTKLDETRKIIHENRDILKSVRVVYGFSDAMAMIVSDEAEKMNIKNKICFIGVDGQLGYGRGLDGVKKKRLQASIVYPPGGDVAIETAMKIINKIPVQKDISMPLTLIDSSNIESYYQQEIYIQSYQNKIELLQSKTKAQLSGIRKEKTVLLGVFISSILLIILALYSFYRIKSYRIQSLEIQQNLEEKLYQQEQELVQIENHMVEELNIKNKEAGLSNDLEKFREKVDTMINENYVNDNFSVNNLVDGLNLSRMHLYRKFKLSHSDTPNNYIRKFRLKKAIELINQGDLNFSEIAYKVGFTSPAYFTKCFKEEYLCTPSEYVQRNNE